MKNHILYVISYFLHFLFPKINGKEQGTKRTSSWFPFLTPRCIPIKLTPCSGPQHVISLCETRLVSSSLSHDFIFLISLVCSSSSPPCFHSLVVIVPNSTSFKRTQITSRARYSRPFSSPHLLFHLISSP